MEIALIGAGQRGMIYAEYAYKKGIPIAAIVEPVKERRELAAKQLHVDASRLFGSAEEFFAAGKLCEAVIIASMDRDHFKQTMAALSTGYDILLEKPISPDPIECLKIQEKAKEAGKLVVVCHVLRYTAFFGTLKDILQEGTLGKIITIQHNENIGNYHFAHSFVRGNWRRSDLSSPLVMQKSCHDMDLLTWLIDSGAKKISSFGSLSYFKEENAPKESTARCLDCPVENCRFHALKAYLPALGNWPATVVTPDQTEEGMKKALLTSPYGRCVYRCDNDVCDRQVTILEFQNGVTATFHLSAFTNRVCRTIKVMCEHGEIRGGDGLRELEITKFASNGADQYEQRVIRTGISASGHGGGDAGIMEDFLCLLQDKTKESITSISHSVESHIMAYAAEVSRTKGITVDVEELRTQLMKKAKQANEEENA